MVAVRGRGASQTAALPRPGQSQRAAADLGPANGHSAAPDPAYGIVPTAGRAVLLTCRLTDTAGQGHSHTSAHVLRRPEPAP